MLIHTAFDCDHVDQLFVFQFGNEFREIILFRLMLGTGSDSLERAARAVKEPRDALGVDTEIETWASDICCADRATIESVFPHLKEKAITNSPASSMDDLKLPTEPLVIDTYDCVIRVVDVLGMRADTLRGHGLDMLTLSLDCEWVYPGGKVALLQLAINDPVIGKQVWLIRTVKLGDVLPRQLKRFLLRRDIRFVGRQLGGDKSKLGRDFDIPELLEMADNWIELGALSAACYKVELGISGHSSLALLSSRILGKRLNKEQQSSDWNQDVLSAEQIQYAARSSSVYLVTPRSLCGVPAFLESA